MRHQRLFRRLALLLVATLACSGCNDEPSKSGSRPPSTPSVPTPAPVKEDPGALIPYTHVALGPNVFLEVVQEQPKAIAWVVGGSLVQAGSVAGLTGVPALGQGQLLVWYPSIAGGPRRVVVTATVCLRQGFLEQLLSRTQSEKQHESILTAEFDAFHVHTGLLAAGAKPGKPVQFQNDKGEEDFRPPSGDKIKVTLQYEDKGKLVAAPAQGWIRASKSKKPLEHDWLFAGSRFYLDPEGKRPPYYGANEGRVICVANFPNALLDLEARIREGDPTEGLEYEANTPAIPPKETPVRVILEPLPKK